MKVLIVEDSQPQRSLLNQLVSKNYNVIVHEAENGEIALDMIKNEGPYLCVMSDLNMPQMGGLELLSCSKTYDKNLPFILCSTDSEKRELIKGMQQGADSFFIKPYKIESLRSKLQPFLSELTIPKTE